MQERQQLLQRPELLQRQGLPRDVEGRVRCGQGESLEITARAWPGAVCGVRPAPCSMKMPTRASLGFGLGLRVDHYEAILAERPAIDWFEVLTENYLVPGGKPLHYLGRIREHYPLAMHGVSMSIGGTAPLDREYLRQVKARAARVEPAGVSDPLAWNGGGGRKTQDPR